MSAPIEEPAYFKTPADQQAWRDANPSIPDSTPGYLVDLTDVQGFLEEVSQEVESLNGATFLVRADTVKGNRQVNQHNAALSRRLHYTADRLGLVSSLVRDLYWEARNGGF